MRKSIIELLTCVVVFFGAFCSTGCKSNRGDGNDKQLDVTKTQLNIGTYDAGIGTSWIDAVGAAFEKTFENYSFEEGKTGVQVWCDPSSDTLGSGLYATISTSSNHIFATESIDYYMFVNDGKIRDVSEIVKKPAITGVDANGEFTVESKTIESKLDSELASFLSSVGGGSYYALPFYTAANGVVYDMDLWHKSGLYFAKGGCPSEVMATVLNKDGYTEDELAEAITSYNAMDKSSGDYYLLVNGDGKRVGENDDTDYGLSAGPDGKYGTYDDGLPALYEEFYYLCDNMVNKSITPFIWTGKSIGYADKITVALWQNYEGADQMRAYYALNGEVKDLVKLDGAGKIVYENGAPVTESKTFDGGASDGYDMHRMAGKYYALQFAEKIATNSTWTASACYAGVSQIQAQSTYLTSVNNPPRIAMLMDGSWWQQESTNTFNIMAKQNEEYSKENRRFGMLYLPNATVGKYTERVEKGLKDTIVAPNDSYLFLNSNMNPDSGSCKAAETFFSFLHSDAIMNLFTANTYIKRSLDYDVDDDTYENLTYFGKRFLDYVDNAEVVYPNTGNEFVNKNYSEFQNTAEKRNFHTLGAFGEVYNPLSSLHDSTLRKRGITAETYFEGMYGYYKNRWTQYSK